VAVATITPTVNQAGEWIILEGLGYGLSLASYLKIYQHYSRIVCATHVGYSDVLE